MPRKSKPRKLPRRVGAMPSGRLRERAEALLQAKTTGGFSAPTEDVTALVQELNVHQMELEIQNEELRRAQVELAQSRDRYTDLYEFAPAGYLILDAGGVIREANLAAAAMLGVERGKLLRRKFAAFVAPTSQEPFFLHRQAVFAHPDRQVVDVELCPTGTRSLWVRLQSMTCRNERGGEPDWRLALSDVSTLKETERQLAALNGELERRVGERTAAARESGSRLAGIIGSAMDAIVSVGPDQRIILFNAAAERMFGWPAARVIGEPLDRLIPEDQREAIGRTSGNSRGMVRPAGRWRDWRRCGDSAPMARLSPSRRRSHEWKSGPVLCSP